MPMPSLIETRQHLRQFMHEVLGELGWGYHPDTPFGDYVNGDTGEPTYTAEQAAERDALQDQAFEVFGDALYDLALESAYEWAGIRYDPELDMLVYRETGAVVSELPYPGATDISARGAEHEVGHQ